MTWSLLNTITPTTTADNHTMFTYLFDTAMQGRGGWTTAAHPDASSFKRKYSITLPNPNRGGANDTRYYWANWSSTSPTALTIYGDATYTTTPGDLCTYTTYNSTQNAYGNGVTNNYGSYRFWTSDQNTGAMLVTMGKRLAFYWPGWTEWALPLGSADSWDGTKGPANMYWPFPAMGVGNYNMYMRGSPTADNNSGSYYVNTWWGGMGYSNLKVAYPNVTLFKAPPYFYMGGSSSPSAVSYIVAAGADDVYGYWPGAGYVGISASFSNGMASWF